MRLVLLTALDDDAVRALRGILPLVSEIGALLEDLAPPRAPARTCSSPPIACCATRRRRRGWTPVAHPALALPALLGQRLEFARLSGDVDALAGIPGVVPYWLERGEDGAWAFAVLSGEAIEAADDAGIAVSACPLRHEVQDALLVQLDEGARRTRARRHTSRCGPTAPARCSRSTRTRAPTRSPRTARTGTFAC